MAVNKQEDLSLTIPLLLSYGDVGTKAKEEQSTNTNIATGTASFISTCFNCVNALSGIGILSIPYALASGGWLSFILLPVMASITLYTGLLIQRCMKADPTIRTYPDIGHRAFGNSGKILISIIMNLELYLVATGFLILEGDNLSNIFPDLHFNICGIHLGPKSGFVVIVAIIILPTTWLNDLGVLSYISASGVLSSVIILGSVFWAGAFDGIGFQENGKIVKWNGLPSTISIYAFCYCVHPAFPTLYTSMKNQRQFSKVLLVCFTFCTITYSLMAVIGYLMFGSNVESEITLNLPTNNLSSKVAIFATLVTPIAKYALMLTPIIDTIEAQLQYSYKKRSRSFIIRTILMISTVGVALSLPFFVYLMSLVGALLGATASITIPCLCYLKISGTYKRIGVEMILVGFVGLIGLIVAIIGCYESL